MPTLIRSEKFGWYLDSPLSIFINGKFAVAVFFVLSGYVLSAPFFLSFNQNALSSAAFRRYFRLAIPVFFSSLICYLLLEFKLFQNQNVGRYFTRSTEYLSLLYNFNPNFFLMAKESLYTIFFGGVGDMYKNYNHVLWTIHYEFLGSFLVYSFLGIFGKWNTRWIVYPFLILIFYQSYFLSFIFGIILSDYVGSLSFKKIPNFGTWLIFLIGIIIGSYTVRDNLGLYKSFLFLAKYIGAEPEILYYSIGAAMIILGINLNRDLIKILNIKIFHFLGKISFSIYLLHVPIIFSFDCAVFLVLKSFINNYIILVSLTFILGTSFLLISSKYFYLLIDLQSVNYTKKLFNYITDKN